MNQPTQRRGLGRGLGSLIPTAPPQAAPRAEESIRRLESPGRRLPTAPGGAHAAVTLERDHALTGETASPTEVAGAYFAELPRGRDRAQRPPAA